MANPFGDAPVDGAASAAPSANPFGDAPADAPRGYLAASGRAGLEDLKGVLWTTLDAVQPFTTTEADVATLFKDDPKGFKDMMENNPGTFLSRWARQNSEAPNRFLSNLTPEAAAQAKLHYATTSPSQAAWGSGTRVAGDVLRSAPSSAAMLASMIFTRGAAKTAYVDAIAAGATPEVAKAMAMKAGAQTMAVAGASSEGVVGAAQQYNQTLSESDAVKQEQLEQSPAYKALIAQGWDPTVARAKLTTEAATLAGQGAGASDAAVNLVGGRVMGKIIGEGGKMLPRIGKGAATEAVTEALQSPLEQASGNLGQKIFLNPYQDVLAGTGEAMVQGAVVGGASGGSMSGVIGHNVHGNADRVAALNKAANEQEALATTGLTKSQADLVNDVSGANASKPKLTPIQSQIVIQAAQMGVDPRTALTIASIETGGRFDPNAKNPKSSAQGIFQQIDSNWNETGGGDRADVGTQIRNGIASIANTQQALEKRLGRAPNAQETYLGHLLGSAGAAALIESSRTNPDGSFRDTAAGYAPKNADAIVDGNGLTGLSNSEAMKKVFGWVESHQLRLGQNVEMNMALKASQESDMAPDHSLTHADSAIEEIDRMLAEDEAKPLTPEEEMAARAEDASVPDANPTAEGVTHATALDSANTTDSFPAVDNSEPRLPRELAAANPRYGFGGGNVFAVNFQSDIDRAAYIVADGAKRSQGDSRFLAFLMDNTGMTEEAARAYGKEIRKQVKEAANAAKNTGVDSITIGDVAKRSDSFSSLDEARTRNRYTNPNDQVAISATPIAFGSADAVGKTLKDRAIQPGEVLALNIEGPHTPAPYVAAVQATLQDWVSRFAPTARVALTFRTENANAVSSFQAQKRLGKSVKNFTGVNGLYQINMRNATNLGVTEDGSRNSTTQKKISYALAHEFGHVLADQEFKRGLPADLQAKFDALGVEEYFTPEDLARMPPAQAAVLGEYNSLKQQVLTDPKFTAEKFMRAWLSPWKLSHGHGANQGPVSFAKKYLGEGAAQQMNDPAKRLAMLMNVSSDILSPHEYMAEQMARYAYSTKMLENSPLGVADFFKQALSKMREFFTSLKKKGELKPGTEFAAWVDGLTKESQDGSNPTVPADAVATPKPKASRPAKVKAAPKAEPPSILPPSKETAQVIQQIAPEATNPEIVLARHFLNTELKHLKVTNPRMHAELSEMIKNGQTEEFKYEVQQYLPDEVADKMRWDTDNAEHMEWRDVARSLEGKLAPRAGLKPWFQNGLRQLSDIKYFVSTMRQMAFANPEVAGLQHIDNMMTAYKSFKSKLEFRAVEAAAAWSKLGKEQAGLMEQAMRDEHFTGEHLATLSEVNGTYRFTPSEALLDFAKKKGLGESTVKVWLDAKNAYLQHMNVLHNVLRQKLEQRLAEKPKALRLKKFELAQMFSDIRSTPFLPQTRFGEYALKVLEDHPDGPKVVHVEFFESKAMRDEAKILLEKNVGQGRKVEPAKYSNTAQILRSLPPQILSTYAEEFELTTRQRQELREIADAITRNPQTRKYSSQLAEITGANKGLLRNFADFMWHDSNNIAKLHYKEHFMRGLRLIAEDVHDAAIAQDFERHDELVKLSQFSDSYVKHIMNPADEWQKVRSFVIFKQLWGNIKTALANANSLAQLWALSSKQQGLVGGTLQSGRTTLKVLNDSIQKGYQKVMRQPVEGGQVFSADERFALNQAKVDGILDETFAAQLASFSNIGTLTRLNMERTEGTIKKILWAGMVPQHLVENFTRRVTLLNQFKTYMTDGVTKEQAYEKARQDVYLLQGDNTMNNRPAFMRGKAAMFTIYYGYMQNMLYLMSGGQERARNYRAANEAGLTQNMTLDEARKKYYKIDKLSGETVKMWAAYAMLGGLMGLPGAEDLDKVLELVSSKVFGNRFSLKEHAYKLAHTISEEASSFGVDISPRSVVHGNMSDFSMFGLLPSIDVSPSMSLGQALPGTGGINKLGNRGGLGDFIAGAMGPLGTTFKDLQDTFGDDPSILKKLGLVLPNTAKNVAKAWDGYFHGVVYPSGGRVTFDKATGQIRDITTGEMLAQLMGFQPSIVSSNKELHWMQKDAQDYWVSRRNGLVAQLWEAQRQGDREAAADVREAIAKFNASAEPKLRLSAADLNRSLASRKKGAKADEQQTARTARFKGLYQGIADDFKSSE
jgi:hypothetical protein